MKTTKKANPTPKATTKSMSVPAAKPTKEPTTSGKPARKRPIAPHMPPQVPEVAMGVTHVEIATRAYFIYVRAGRPEGQEMQHWLEAEPQLPRR